MNPDTLDQNSSEIAALKNQVFTLFMALIVISGTLTVYLYRESSLAGKDLVQAERLDALVTQNENVLGNFISKLSAYGEKHPDFLPVLKKYGIVPQPAAPKK
jgi:hypothetical protein